MKEDPTFNIAMVQEVEKHSVLYDPSNSGYNNREEQDKAWQAVAAAVRDTASSCKDRWKHLRSALCRHQRRQSCSIPGMGKKPYYLVEYMQFLLPFTRVRVPKPENGNYEIISGGDNSRMFTYNESMLQQQFTASDSAEDTFDIKSEVEDLDDNDDCQDEPINNVEVTHGSPTDADDRTTPAPPVKRRRLDETQISSDDVATSQVIKSILEDRDDPDVNFLRSLIPEMRRMTNPQKNNFKIATLQMINAILYNAD